MRTRPSICPSRSTSATWAHARARGESPFAATLYALGVAVHAVEAFRLRIRGGDVVAHDVVHPGFVAMGPDEQIRFCGVPWSVDRVEFLASVRDGLARAAAEEGVAEAHPTDDAFFVSAMPWLAVRAVRHARSGDPDDSVPRFAWGAARAGPAARAVRVGAPRPRRRRRRSAPGRRDGSGCALLRVGRRDEPDLGPVS